MKKDVLIIMPAFNEGENLRRTLDRLKSPEIASLADVLVLNDASRDETRYVLQEAGVRSVDNVFNLGYGSSLQVGYKYAVRHGYRWVLQMDADGQHDPCNIVPLIRAAKEPDENGKLPDIVLGCRYLKDSAPFEAGMAKQLAYRWFRALIRLGTGVSIADPTTGLQVLNRRVMVLYSAYRNFDDRYPDANMLLQMLLNGFRIRQVPAVMHARKSGSSMHSGIIAPMLYMLRMTISILVVYFHVKVLHVDQPVIEQLKREFQDG